MTKEIPIGTKSTCYSYHAKDKVKISFYKENDNFFYIGFPREGHTIEIPIEELTDILEFIKVIKNLKEEIDNESH